MPSPYGSYDKSFIYHLQLSLLHVLARGYVSISASISAVINTTSKQFRGNGRQLTSHCTIKGYANYPGHCFSLPGIEISVCLHLYAI